MNSADTPYRDDYQSTKSFNLSTNYSIKSVQVTGSHQQAIRLSAKPLYFRGYIEGLRQPASLITLSVSRLHSLQLKNLQTALKYYFTDCPAISPNLNLASDLVSAFGEILCFLQKKAGFPIFEPIQNKLLPNKTTEFLLFVPIYEESFLPSLIDFTLQVFNRSLVSVPALPDEALISHIKRLINFLSAYAPKGSNSLRFLQAAHDLGIPWLFVEQNTFQLGNGVKSRWLDSSFTDKTSLISAGLARNKASTAMLLLKAGLPVPEHYLAQTEAEALSLAKKIGYPVVVKPLNEDGGLKVFAKLQSDDAVKQAFWTVKVNQEPVLIEKHILGKDYRLQVLHGELIWAIERIPAGIIGDGKKNISRLIHEKVLERTEEMLSFLAEQGYSLESILPLDKFIPISRIANISAGGTPVGVFDRVHPDNKRLAETAARLLRLDIAGIDLIMPDIEQSYLETTGTIIEVNAQPQLGIITAPHIYKEILLKLVPDQGRIPIIVVLGKPDTSFIETLKTTLLSQFQVVGTADAKGAQINDNPIAFTESIFTAVRSLLLNNSVDALICSIQSLEALSLHGLPFDSFDYLFCHNKSDTDQTVFKGIDWLGALTRACRGPVITAEPKLDSLMPLAGIR